MSGVRGWGKRKLQNNDMEEKVLEAFVPDCQWGSPKANGLLQQNLILFYFMIIFLKNPDEINHNTKLAGAVQYLSWVVLVLKHFHHLQRTLSIPKYYFFFFFTFFKIIFYCGERHKHNCIISGNYWATTI